MPDRAGNALRDYLIAAACVAVAALVRVMLHPLLGTELRFITFYPAVMVAVYFGGVRSGIATLVLSLVVGTFMAAPGMNPVSLSFEDRVDLVRFTLVGIVITLFNGWLRTARRQLLEQRDMLRTTLTSIGDGVLTTDLEARITMMNAVAERLTGWSAAEARGRSIEDVLDIRHAESGDVVPNPVREALDRRRIATLGDDVVLVGKDGIERPIEDSAAPIVNRRGRVTGCVMILRDVSERRRAARAIRVSEEQLADFFENANVGIHWVGPDAVIQRANQAELDMLGYDRNEYLGRSIADFHADTDVIAEILERLKNGEQLRQFPARLVRKDGEIRDCLISSSVYWEGGEFVHTRCITVDVTDHLRNETDLLEAQELLKETDRRKDEFLATLAHELRNPLAPVRNSLEILRRSREKPLLIDQALSTMERQMTHLERLVDDLIDISRISRGWIELRKSSVELASIVFSAVETVRPLAEQKSIDIELNLPPQPVFLNADPVRMAQIVTNLLTNAVKYTPAGGHITLSADSANDRMALSVRDTGLGIPADMLPKVFEMFMQIDRNEEGSRGGLGIGLTLVKRLVELHDGTIEARSEGPGRGSEFVVHLPTVPAGRQELRPAPPTPLRATPRRILVADDNEDAARTLQVLLDLSGHETYLAFDGQDALEKAERFRPDIVLLDIGMPKLTGHEVAKSLREQPWFEGRVLIALTGWGQEMDRRKSREVGFDHHLVKPIDPAALLALIASLPEAKVAQ